MKKYFHQADTSIFILFFYFKGKINSCFTLKAKYIPMTLIDSAQALFSTLASLPCFDASFSRRSKDIHVLSKQDKFMVAKNMELLMHKNLKSKRLFRNVNV